MFCLHLSAVKLLKDGTPLQACCCLIFESDNGGDADWLRRLLMAEVEKNKLKETTELLFNNSR